MRTFVSALICVLFSQLLALLLIPVPVLADPAGVLVSELQVASNAQAGDEFVELYNPTPADIDMTGWVLQYHAGSNTDCSKDWTTKTKLTGATIVSHGFYLFSSTGYLNSADASFSPGLAAAGAIRLQNTNGGTEAALAWGKAACGNGNPAAVPPAGSSLERRPGSDVENGGNAYNTGDDYSDFQLRAVPNPQSSASATEDPVAGYTPQAPVGTGSTGGASGGTVAGASSGDPAVVELNELLPDPAAPLTDAHDEFIEIYNPNDAPVDLAGYVVKTGASLSTKHTLPDTVVGAGGYVALISGVTKIQLANAGSSVALFDPDGTQLGATVIYPKAPTGDAWALNSDIWSWTTTPTPGAPNLITTPAAGAPGSGSSSTKNKASKATSTKAKAAKALKAAQATVASAAAPAAAAASTTGGRWLLFTLGGLTIAYVIYEFRHDLRNYYFKLRGHAGGRPGAGTSPERRRRARAGE